MVLHLPTFEKLYGTPVPLTPGQTETQDGHVGKLPEEVLDLWRRYGRCQFGDGLLRLVHPETFTPVLEAFGFDPDRQFAFMENAFGDLFLYDAEHITYVDAKHGWAFRCENDLEIFFEVLLAEPRFFKSVLWGQKYAEVRRRLGPLADHQIYGFVPALVLGGPEEDDHLARVEAVEHLVFLGQLTTLQVR